VDTITRGFLGLTVACARCHDHKYDPIPTQDYYSLTGVIAATRNAVIPIVPDDRVADLTAFAVMRNVAGAFVRSNLLIPSRPLALCNGAADVPKPEALRVYLRGNPSKKGEIAPRRFLRILAGPDAPKFAKGSGRLQLAEAIADAGNPLTSRVIVNRIWQQHFGRGIVATASNFGQNGARPTHPELLDYLAAEFVKDGWSVKRLHRQIMLSEAYQRASDAIAANEAADPENQWLWRMPRLRLTVEAFRDAVLAVAGNLDLTAGGPSEDLASPTFVRRTVYGRVSRHDLAELLRLFDFPAPNISSDRRTDTTLPQQALFLMNSPFMAAQAKLLAARLQDEATPAARVRKAYRLTLARDASEDEVTVAVNYLSAADAPLETVSKKSPATPTRLERFAQALLASNEFFYVD
jgi:hypothetical protein